MNKLHQTKTYVKDHTPHIVAAASVATTIGVLAYFKSKHLLEVTPEHVRRLEQGGHYTYVVLDRVFHLTLAD